MLSARGWTIAEDNPHSFVLQSGAREVFVALVPTLNAATLARSSPRGGGINVILTLRVDEGAVNRGARWLIIDVIRSRVVSGVFPDATYADLFRPLY
jgi:hypothetical protein